MGIEAVAYVFALIFGLKGSLRLSFILPTVALKRPIKILKCWKESSSYTWKIFEISFYCGMYGLGVSALVNGIAIIGDKGITVDAFLTSFSSPYKPGLELIIEIAGLLILAIYYAALARFYLDSQKS